MKLRQKILREITNHHLRTYPVEIHKPTNQAPPHLTFLAVPPAASTAQYVVMHAVGNNEEPTLGTYLAPRRSYGSRA